YGWARLVGEHGLRSLAERLHQTPRLERVSARLREAGAREIALSRLIPGMRVYTTLVAGAAGVDRRRFFTGIGPATALWVIAFTLLGVVAGVPAEHFFTEVQQLAVQGGVLVAIGVGGYLAILRLPEGGHEALFRLPPGLRMTLALGIDLSLIASVVAGVLAVVRPLSGAGDIAAWVDLAVVLLVIALFYSVATRRGAHATAGERVLGTSYLTQGNLSAPGERRLGSRLRGLLRDLPSDPSPELGQAADFFRLLGDQRRLRIVRLLLEGERSAAELEKALGLSHLEMSYLLAELQRVGILDLLEESPEAGPTRYTITDPYLGAALADLLAVAISRRPLGTGSPQRGPPPEPPHGGEGRTAGDETEADHR
ncbi:MAG: helix-turn-helix domain-containing protein, partial [Candidatus Dormibacteraeota bacterium]|nr:helix-turn-helix domain-containing protein [Candidatus Dormibacteraeota bacterium]